jgi:hypothetical protein
MATAARPFLARRIVSSRYVVLRETMIVGTPRPEGQKQI